MNILVLGATSAIAQATARLWARQGHALFLLGRDTGRLSLIAADLRVRGAVSVGQARFDAGALTDHARMLDEAVAALGGTVDVALVAHGSLPDQQACERDPALALQALEVNALSVISLLTLLANRMEAQGRGSLVVIGSVAGDRGRQSNYVYGTAKAAVATFLQGLRNRLHGRGVHVLTVKPGFVDTPMTAHLPKGGPLWATPERVAAGILAALRRRADVVYLPWFWAGIMLVIRLVPERVFKKLRL